MKCGDDIIAKLRVGTNAKVPDSPGNLFYMNLSHRRSFGITCLYRIFIRYYASSETLLGRSGLYGQPSRNCLVLQDAGCWLLKMDDFLILSSIQQPVSSIGCTTGINLHHEIIDNILSKWLN
jgi:hypothetical protein